MLPSHPQSRSHDVVTSGGTSDEKAVHQQVENLRRWLRSYAQAERKGMAAPLSEPVLTQLEQTIEALSVSDDDLRLHLDSLRRNAARLDQERARYRELLDLAPDAYLLTDLEGTVLDANAAAADLLGVPRGTLSGRPLSLYVFPEDKPIYWEWLAELETVDRTLQWELRVNGPDGAERHVIVRARRAADAAELRWMLRDISERIRAEETERRLRQERAERQAADAAARHARFLARAGRILNEAVGTASVAEAIVEAAVPTLGAVALLDLLDRDGRTVRFAAPAGAVSGRLSAPATNESDSAIGSVLASGELDVLPALDAVQREQLAPGAPDLLDEMKLNAAVLVPLKRKEGVVGVLTLLGTTVEDCCARDLLLGKAFGETAALALDNARLLEAARASSRAKSDFISFLSHEFRTPLTSIVGYADLLDTETGGPLTDLQRRQLHRLRAGAWHLSRLVDETLYFSRESTFPPALEVTDVDLRQLAVECVHGFRPAAAERGLELALHAPAAPLLIRTDAGRLRQILINLIGNAMKFTDAGTVRVEIRNGDEGIEVAVHDSGIGIPAEQLESVFEPFRQAHQGRGGGSGLGLAVARQLARRLGGDVSVQSVVSTGTTFTLRLPVDLRSE